MNFRRKQDLAGAIEPRRILVVYGPRRVGKTTALEIYLRTQPNKQTYYSTGDDIELREVFKSESRTKILDFARPHEIIALDEAQYVPSIGLGAKMIIDAFPEKNVILTGSSSLSLSRQIGEPLTGRHFTLTLLPIAQSEIKGSRFELGSELESFLIYGSYPEVLNEPNKERKIKILAELVSSYLFKDALALEAVRSPDVLLDVAKGLAFQVGREVSVNEIARLAKTDSKTAARYLDLLEKMFIVRRVRGYIRNLRNEISKKAKYYFLDNGIRNAIISQFNPLSLRDDIGALWENFIFMELAKQSNLKGKFDNYYFWRTHVGQEIDIIKENNGILSAIECKWSRGDASPPKSWRTAYPEASFTVIHRENYLDLIL